MATPDLLITRASSHQLYIERLAAQFGNDVIPYLDRIEKGTQAILDKNLKGNLTIARQQRVIDEIDALSRSELQAYVNEYKVNNRAFGAYEADNTASTLDDIVISESFTATAATAAKVNSAAVVTPIKLGDNLFTTYNTYLSNYWSKYADQINGSVAAGFDSSLTTQQISQNIMRTISQDYEDSSLSRARREAKTLARTGTNHMATSARRATVGENDDVITGWIFVATLDNRTSKQCSALDSTTYKLNESNIPFPPLHPNCRSTMAYEIDARYSFDNDTSERPSNFKQDGKREPKRVSSKKTYYEELSTLKASDQDAILGSTLGKAFRKMNNPDAFAKATLDSLNNPLTLKQMKARDNELSRILKAQS